MFRPSATTALLGFLAGAFVLSATLPHFLPVVGAPRAGREELQLLRSTVQIGSLQIAIGVLATVDVVVAAISSVAPADAASYQVAAAVGKSCLFLSTAVSLVVFPLLDGSDDHRLKSAALRSYALAAGFVALALASAPPSLVRSVFADGYDSVARWLPYTAGLGFAVGLANVLTTFVQSRVDPGGRRRVAGAVAVLVLSARARCSWPSPSCVAATGRPHQGPVASNDR